MEKELFEQLVEGLEEAVAISKGLKKPSRVFRIEPVDVAATRKRLKLSQTEFAAMLGVSERTLQSWEQGRRRPSGAASMLIRVAAKHPKAVLDAAYSV